MKKWCIWTRSESPVKKMKTKRIQFSQASKHLICLVSVHAVSDFPIFGKFCLCACACMCVNTYLYVFMYVCMYLRIFIFCFVFLYSRQIKCSPLTATKSSHSVLKNEHRHRCTQKAGGTSLHIGCPGIRIFQSLEIMKLATHFHLGGSEYKSPLHTDLLTERNPHRRITGISIKKWLPISAQFSAKSPTTYKVTYACMFS